MLELWLWLAHRPGMNEHTKLLLLQYFGSPEGIFNADPREFSDIPGLTSLPPERHIGRSLLKNRNYPTAKKIPGFVLG